ncbi:hypothetical protein [Flavobacterium mesophilum]|uniref:hypothetical protein n=1 Tax=Flavobacterium mesophilum TaxID=3143495 RepID=UPI0031E1A589
MSKLLHCGSLRNVLIKDNHSAYSLNGMLNPTFQNQGTAAVTIDGRILLPDETYTVFAPLVLQGNVPIVFEEDKSKKRMLYIGFVSVI